MYLLETTKYVRKYKCMYCEKKYDREKLASHIDKYHSDMIPEGYTGARLVFNMINKKETGKCCICGKETQWNENTYRYDRICSDKCRSIAAENAKKNMIKIYNKPHLLNDPEYQEKMLKGRSISGTYKFSHGGTVDYTGTYEKKLLEFIDKVMGMKSTDIINPGPVISYEYKGEQHFWITDYYLIPFNLVFDVKDGGDNPNNRSMESYREKQVAKENAIKKLNKYNYIRLTNNEFDQLLYVMAELKMRLADPSNDTEEKLIKINEASLELDCNTYLQEYGTGQGAMVGMGNTSLYVVPYLCKNTFDKGYAISNDITLDSIFTVNDKGDVIKKNKSFLDEECIDYEVFKFNGSPRKPEFNPKYLAEVVTGVRFISDDQIYYDNRFTKVTTLKEYLQMEEECLTATFLDEDINVLPAYDIDYINEENIMFLENTQGVYVKNTKTGYRSKEYSTRNDIPNNVIKYITNGKI